jgi:hypothetical protein
MDHMALTCPQLAYQQSYENKPGVVFPTIYTPC